MRITTSPYNSSLQAIAVEAGMAEIHMIKPKDNAKAGPTPEGKQMA